MLLKKVIRAARPSISISILCGSSTGDYPKPARRSINTKIKIYKNHKKWHIFFSFQ